MERVESSPQAATQQSGISSDDVGPDPLVRPFSQGFIFLADETEGSKAMDQKNESVLRLLQDIKEMLFGIALILLGGIMVIRDSDGLILLGGVFLLLYGAYHVWNGKNHELSEKNDESQKQEQQGGSHGL